MRSIAIACILFSSSFGSWAQSARDVFSEADCITKIEIANSYVNRSLSGLRTHMLCANDGSETDECLSLFSFGQFATDVLRFVDEPPHYETQISPTDDLLSIIEERDHFNLLLHELEKNDVAANELIDEVKLCMTRALKAVE